MKEEEGLDKVFKQGLSEPGHIADYRESDWDAFEQMLEEKGEKRPVIFWLRIASGIAAMLLLAFGWFYMQQNNTEVVKPGLAVHPDANKNNNVADGGSVRGGKQPGVVPSAQTNNIAAATDKKDNDNTGTSGGLLGQKAGGLNHPPSSVNSNHVLAMDKPYRKDKSFFTLSSPRAARRDTAGLVNNDVTGSRNPNEVLAAVYEKDVPAAKLSAGDIYSGRPLLFGEQLYIDKITDPFVTADHHAQLSLTFLASPDINTVNAYSNAEVGSNFGLHFSVTVSKFTFSTGAIYAKAPYLTPFEDYHTPYVFKYQPSNVSADCRVLDIPLNIDYQLYSKARNSFSIGTGLSSYIMLSEDYKYNYAYPYTNPANYPAGISIVNQNQHFLGVLNLDATYKRRLNSKFSLDVQPYLKIPLTGIGYSQVKLQTAGVALGLSWNLNNKQRP